MHPHGNRFALTLFPIPVRKEVQHRIRSPPCFVVIKVVFGKATHVDDAELRVDRRPPVRGRLTAVVEAGPGEAAREPFTGGIELPPLLGELRPRSVIQIVSAHPVAQLIRRINTARRNRAGRLRPHRRRLSMVLVPCIVNLQVVIESHDVELLGKVRVEGCIHRSGTHACGVEFVRASDHVIDDADALRLKHHRPLFIAHRPKNDRRRVAVALDHGFYLRHAFRIGAHQSGFTHHHHAHAIAGLDPLRRGHVMRSAHRIPAYVFQHRQAKRLQAVGKRRADSCVILMIAGAFDLDRLAVEEESFVGVPSNVAHAEVHALGIARLASGLDCHRSRIEIRSLRRPERRIRQAGVCRECRGAVRCDRLLR